MRHTTRHRRNALKLKLSKKVIILRKLSLPLVHLNKNSWLIICIRTKRLSCLLRNRRIPLNNRSHNAASSLQTKRQRCNIQKNHILRLCRTAHKNVCLNSCTICNSLIRIHTVIQLLPSKIIRKQLTNLRNTRRTTHHNNFINLALVHLGISQKSVQGGNCPLEKCLAQTLKLCTGQSCLKVNTLKQGINLNRRLGSRTQGPLCTLAHCTKAT